MTFTPVDLPTVVQQIHDQALAAVTVLGVDDDHPDGVAPSYEWVDLVAPPRKPELVCDQGALASWIEPTKLAATQRGSCLALTMWPVRVRWWICWPSVNADLSIPIEARQAHTQRIQTTALAVQRALADLCCTRPPDGVNDWQVGFSRPVTPGLDSAGWEWIVTVTM